MARVIKSQTSNPNATFGLVDDYGIDDYSFDVYRINPFLLLSGDLDLEINSFELKSFREISLSDELSIEDDVFHFYLSPFFINDEIDIDFYQNFTEQLIEVQEIKEIDPGDSVSRLDSIERDLVVSSVNPEYYKEFKYSGDNLIGYSLYSNSSKNEMVFDINFLFDGENLYKKNITRIVDNKTLSLEFVYSENLLISQIRTII